MSVAIIDTSVFCELLAVPGKTSDVVGFRGEFQQKIEAGEVLLLPMTTILETGNHIGQCSSKGDIRRHYAKLFVDAVLKALDGDAPFSPTRFFDPREVRGWLSEFPDWVCRTDRYGRGSGLGDLTIKKEWERQCALNRARRVYIWSQDNQLSACDKAPEL